MSITEGQLKTIRDLFFSYDYNGDGKLNAKEFAKFTNSIGEILSKQEAEEAISQLDKNGDYVIDIEEFIKFFIGE